MIFLQEQKHQFYICSTSLSQPVEWYKLSSSIEINKPFLAEPKVYCNIQGQAPFLVVANNHMPDQTNRSILKNRLEYYR